MKLPSDRRLTVRAARGLEDALDALGHLVVNRPARSVVRRELTKRARRLWKDAGRALARLVRRRTRPGR